MCCYKLSAESKSHKKKVFSCASFWLSHKNSAFPSCHKVCSALQSVNWVTPINTDLLNWVIIVQEMGMPSVDISNVLSEKPTCKHFQSHLLRTQHTAMEHFSTF